MRMTLALALAAAFGVALTGCEEVPTPAEVLTNYADDVAIPSYERFVESSETLRRQVGDVCGDGGDVDTALTALVDARDDWMGLQALLTGPAMGRRSPSRVDWPVRTADIEALIERSADGEITADVIGNNVGADTRGLTALRWVLSRDDVADVLADQRWCDYLTSTAGVVAEEAGLLNADWQESWDGGPPFRDVFGDDGEDWLAMVVNDNIFLVHKLTEDVVEEGDVAAVDPSADRAVQLAGVGEVMGALAPLLEGDLGDRLSGEIDAAREAFESGDIEHGRELSTEVEATITTEVVAQLDISITFSDQDGDSAS